MSVTVGGRFELADKIGVGGMGTVYRALDTETGFTVAVKLFDQRTAVDIERAHREAQSLARLAHPAIVAHVADGITEDGQLFLAMEWIPGTTAAQRLQGNGFTLREAVAVTRRIASALAAAHGAGIVHRDIKPSNVLLPDDRADTAMLIDFGIARVAFAQTDTNLTRTGVAIGTPGYMSPEQARGARTLTRAVDVFGLGCVLYELVTGQAAFTGSTPAAIMAKILFSDVIPVAAINPDAPPALCELIARMMERNTATRVADCRAVETALAALAAIPEGRARTNPEPPVEQPVRGQIHCMVIASSGSPEEVSDPPNDEQYRLLVEASQVWNARLEVFANGAVCAHFKGGTVDATHRAGRYALAMRRLLPGWVIALSSDIGAAAVADTSTALLTRSLIAKVFNKLPGNAVAVDPGTAPNLVGDFEVDLHSGLPLLIGEKQR